MFYLESNTNKDGTRIILIDFCYSGKRLRMSTGLTIHPKYWDFDADFPFPKRNFKYYSQYKARLSKYETIVNEAWLDLTLTHIPNTKELADEIKRRFTPKQTYLHEFAYSLAESKKKITQFAYNNVAKEIQEFNPEAKFEDVDLRFMFDFIKHLYRSDTEEPREQNTVAKMLQRFRSIMNAAVMRGLTTNIKYKSPEATVHSIETTKIFLDESELMTFYKTPCTGKLEQARDRLVLAAYTGSRFSDILKFDRTSFKGKYFRVVTQKGTHEIDIPAHPIVFEILEKYDWKIPAMPNSTMNELIKEVGRLAKFNQPVRVISFPGGNRKEQLIPMWQMIETHTGRRSFACNMLLAGLDAPTIMAIGGWLTYKAFSKYIRFTPGNHLEIAYKNAFFQKIGAV